MKPSLFDVLAIPAEMLKYEAFKKMNPWVLPKLTRMCFDLKERGFSHYGIAALVEVMRYEHAMTHDPMSMFKLNNNYRAFMAREIMNNNILLDGFFETRKSVADLSEDY